MAAGVGLPINYYLLIKSQDNDAVQYIQYYEFDQNGRLKNRKMNLWRKTAKL